MQRVFVLDANKQPLMPCHPARAKELLKKGKAAVYRRQPFTIILKERVGGDTQPLAFKIDPGSNTTGLALVAAFQRGLVVIWAALLNHRGEWVKALLLSRRQVRRSRRNRKTRYRECRFSNRRKPAGWLVPSIRSRVANIATWARWLQRWLPLTNLAMELVKFDTQKMQNPEISGIEYQQGTLYGFEIREYLLEKWHRKCAYCGKENIPLQIEHIVPKVRGGSNRVSNLTLACVSCNTAKGTKTAEEFGYPNIQKQAQRPLQDATTVNVTRWAIYRALSSFGFPLEIGTGGRTKFNRTQQGYPKAHWIDAACVGETGERVLLSEKLIPLAIKAMGWGSRQMCRMNQFGFPRTTSKQNRQVHGFRTGDLVKATVPTGKKAGVHQGRVAVRRSGSFRVGVVDGIPWRFCQRLQASDGYEYIRADTTSSVG